MTKPVPAIPRLNRTKSRDKEQEERSRLGDRRASKTRHNRDDRSRASSRRSSRGRDDKDDITKLTEEIASKVRRSKYNPCYNYLRSYLSTKCAP